MGERFEIQVRALASSPVKFFNNLQKNLAFQIQSLYRFKLKAYFGKLPMPTKDNFL